MLIHKGFLRFIMLSMLMILAGCMKVETITEEPQIIQEDPLLQTPEMQTENIDSAIESPSPYQYLTMITGNSEVLAFRFTMERNALGIVENRVYQRLGNQQVESFITEDMNGNRVSVRILETDMAVHYILDDSRLIRSYLPPTEEILLNKMQIISLGKPDSVTMDGDTAYYQYNEPFVEAPEMVIKYTFEMVQGELKRFIMDFEGIDRVVYEFSTFEQEIFDAHAFDYPEDYQEEVFDYSYTGDHMPPWWDVGNDQ